jgi:hypothetical protein
MEMEVMEAMPQPQALPWARTATAGSLGLRIGQLMCALAALATTATTGASSSHPALWFVSCSASRPWSCLLFPIMQTVTHCSSLTITIYKFLFFSLKLTP